MKKRLSILSLFLAFTLLLSGCMAIDATIKVRRDGSGKATGFVGIADYAFNAMVEEGEELPEGEYITKIINGTTYVGQMEEAEFDDITEMDMDGLYITKGTDSFTIFVTPVSAEDISGLDDYGLTMEDMYMTYRLEMPYMVEHIKGNDHGIKVERSVLTIDFTQVDGEHVFYVGDKGTFTDVSADAWYFTAVNWMKDQGLVSGYPNGNFGPNDKLSYAQLAQILYNTAQPYFEEDGEGNWWYYEHWQDDGGIKCNAWPTDFWAGKAITWAIANKYILEDKIENWNDPATREAAVSAITKCYVDLTYEKYSDYGVNIPDLMEIDEAYRDDVVHGYYLGVAGGVDSTGTFAPKSELTRAQICQMYWNLRWAPTRLA